MKPKRSRKVARVPEDVRLGRSILPAGQARAGAFVAVDISNHSESDQRRMVRSGERRTIRRLTRVELMHKAGTITDEQARACAWYAAQHELGFQTVGCTANYGGAGGGGFGAGDLLARYKAQSEARENFHYARSAIPLWLVGPFEAVALGVGRPPHMMSKAERLKFSMAAHLLYQQVGHIILLDG
jgi:hypothetical protein